MIHHLSINALDPKRVGNVLAELMRGACIPFPPNPGAFLAVAGDRYGTAVEVHPARTQLKAAGPAGAEFIAAETDPGLSGVHFALSVGCSREEVEMIAAREGWPCFLCERGGDFGVIELWMEGRLLVEVLPPDFAEQYLTFTAQFAGATDPAALMANHARQAAA